MTLCIEQIHVIMLGNGIGVVSNGMEVGAGGGGVIIIIEL